MILFHLFYICGLSMIFTIKLWQKICEMFSFAHELLEIATKFHVKTPNVATREVNQPPGFSYVIVNIS